MANSVLTETDMRLFAMDRPELNTLVDSIRFSSEAIEKACVMAVDKFNTLTPPSAVYTIETFPSASLLMMGAWGWLLRFAAIGEASNNLSYSVAGVQINDRDKAEIFQALGKELWQEFCDTSSQIKLTQSVNAVYGAKYSEYKYRFF